MLNHNHEQRVNLTNSHNAFREARALQNLGDLFAGGHKQVSNQPIIPPVMTGGDSHWQDLRTHIDWTNVPVDGPPGFEEHRVIRLQKLYDELFAFAALLPVSDVPNEISFSEILETAILVILEGIGQIKMNLQIFIPIIRNYFQALEQIISVEVEKLIEFKTERDRETLGKIVSFTQIAHNVLNKWLVANRFLIEPVLRERPINYDKLWSIYERTERDITNKARFEELMKRLNPERLFENK
jgi:hypothetical protein